MSQETNRGVVEDEQRTGVGPTEVTGSGFTIPNCSVDPSQSLQDRMADNVWFEVGPAYYFECDNDGTEIEDWNGVFDRVAADVAEAEYKFGADQDKRDSWKTEFEKSMRELRFVPNSATLMNDGLPFQQVRICVVGHVNLSVMIDNNAPRFDEFVGRFNDDRDRSTLVEGYLNRALNQTEFEQTVQTGTRFLDNVVTQSEFPLDKISEQVDSMRRIGLSVMGFHQMLIQMGVEYGSDVSYEFAREMMRRTDEIATGYNHELAKVRGSFPAWETSKWSRPDEHPDWFEAHAHRDPTDVDDNGFLVRNHSVTAVAQADAASLIANTTPGWRPLNRAASVDDFLSQTLEANGVDDLEAVPNEIESLFVTSTDLSREQHVRMQDAFREHCDIDSTTHAGVGDSLIGALESRTDSDAV